MTGATLLIVSGVLALLWIARRAESRGHREHYETACEDRLIDWCISQQ